MVTADEIRARVEAADKARIQTRADTAAKIAEQVERRTKIVAELAEIDAAIAAGLVESASVMTLAELAEFTGIPESDLRGPTGAVDSKTRRQSRRKGTVGARRSRPAVAPASGAPVVVSSDI